MLAKSTAIVLRIVDFKESSKIVTLLTEGYGKIAVMARGVNKPKSKFAGLMQPGNLLDVMFYYKQTRSVQNLSEANLADQTWKIRSDIEKMAIATATLEMLEQLTHENEENQEFFEFGKSLLVWLHQSKLSPKYLFPYIQMRLSDLLGVGLQAMESPVQNGYFLNIDEGSVSGMQGSGMAFRLSETQAYYMELVFSGKKSQILKNDFASVEIKNLIHHLDVYIKHHIPEIRDRRSDYIFQQLLQ